MQSVTFAVAARMTSLIGLEVMIEEAVTVTLESHSVIFLNSVLDSTITLLLSLKVTVLEKLQAAAAFVYTISSKSTVIVSDVE